jgi:hypothetical protein
MPRPQAGIKRRILGAGFTRYDASYSSHPLDMFGCRYSCSGSSLSS